MKNDQDIEKLFTDAFQDFEVTPPEQIKTAIDDRLMSRTSHRKFYYMLSLVVLLIVSGTAWFLNSDVLDSQQKQNSKQTAQKPSLDADAESEHSAANAGEKIVQKPIENQEQQQINDAQPLNKSLTTKTPLKDHKSGVSANQENSPSSLYGKKPEKYQKPQAKKGNHRAYPQVKGKKGSYTPYDGFQKTNGTKQQTYDPFTAKLTDQEGKGTAKKELNQVNPMDELFKQSEQKNVVHTEKNEKTSSESEGNKEIAQTPGSELGNEHVIEEEEKSEQKTADEKTSIDNNEKPKQKSSAKDADPNKLPLLLSLKAGTTLAFNQYGNKLDYELKENNLLQMQLEATYNFTTKVGASSGISYYSSELSLSENTTSLETGTFTYVDYIYIDTLVWYPDSSNGYYVWEQWLVDSIQSTEDYYFYSNQTYTSKFKSSSFAVPLLFSYSQKLSNKLYLDLMAGGIIQFRKITQLSGTLAPEQSILYKKTSFSPMLKTHLRYQFNQFGVSISTNFGYHPGEGFFQEATTRRKRFSVDLGLGLHYQF